MAQKQHQSLGKTARGCHTGCQTAECKQLVMR